MIFVTGGTGIIGIRLLFDLLTAGRDVLALKRDTSNLKLVEQCFNFYGNKNLHHKIKWINGDILDIESFIDLLDDNTNVYHCAATVSFKPQESKHIYENNVNGTQNIVNACLQKKIKKLCFVSSVAALGNSDFKNATINENIDNIEENYPSMYTLSKFKGEMEVWRGIAEGLNAVIVNPTVVLGIGHKTRSSNLLFNRIHNGLKYYTQGVTGFVDVKDVSKYMIKLMESDVKNERFILNSENLSFEKLFRQMAMEIGVKPPYIEIKPWMSNLLWRLDWLRKYLLFQPRKFTRSMAESLHLKQHYSAEKIRKKLNVNFIPIIESIKNYAKFYRT